MSLSFRGRFEFAPRYQSKKPGSPRLTHDSATLMPRFSALILASCVLATNQQVTKQLPMPAARGHANHDEWARKKKGAAALQRRRPH